jgi:hypothetical protein
MMEFLADKQFIFFNTLRTGILIDKKQEHKRRVLTQKKLGGIVARFEHTPRKSLKRLAQETGVSKPSARTATQLLKPSSESWCLCAVSARKIVPVFFKRDR